MTNIREAIDNLKYNYCAECYSKKACNICDTYRAIKGCIELAYDRDLQNEENKSLAKYISDIMREYSLCAFQPTIPGHKYVLIHNNIGYYMMSPKLILYKLGDQIIDLTQTYGENNIVDFEVIRSYLNNLKEVRQYDRSSTV